ncbi:CCAAT- binding transcription factor component [Maublancomyces gigas]|uniref:CCAAT- binding transcription factor component n=1 Tax=Discina gigas TaxID=1032678 RepID=A0ABR3GMH2_9PEZI
MDQQFPTAGSRHDPSQSQHQQSNVPPYDISVMGHYGASAALVASSSVPAPDIYSGAFANVSQGLHGHYRDILTTYWQQTINQLENEEHDYKLHQLPLARIKKVMKADPEVKMISAEAPILFAKGCDIFITELTMRAWIHAEENKRRTLQRSDIASALAKSDMFDFLIDIVPREEASHTKRSGGASHQQQPQQPPPQQQPPQPQQQQQVPPQQQPQIPAAPDYLGHPGMTQQDAERYQQQNMYGGGVQPQGSYPQHQMYPEGLEGMYGYPPMPHQPVRPSYHRPSSHVSPAFPFVSHPEARDHLPMPNFVPLAQQMYQLPNQRHLQDTQGAGGSNEQGDVGDADAEGERDYEVP